MKPESTLWTRLTERYLLVIRNEDNFAEKTTVGFTYAKMLVIVTAVLVLVFSVSLLVANFALSRWFHPASKEMQMNRRLINLSGTVDSLQGELVTRDNYLTQLQKTIRGDDKYLKQSGQETTRTGKPATRTPVDLKAVNAVDAEFRSEFESQNKAQAAAETGVIPQTQFLFSPLRNPVISDKFNPKTSHWGIDLVAKKNEPIHVVADGTVVLSSWTQDSGNVIAVQHPNQLISVYKHNSALLKKAGDFVKAGEAVAIIGNSGELTTGPHLHFELWYNGNPVNPEDFIAF